MTAARQWAAMRRWDWNLICVSGIALFFFLMYMTSPDGKYMSRNAACPVPITSLDYHPPHAHAHHHSSVVHEDSLQSSCPPPPPCPVCTCPELSCPPPPPSPPPCPSPPPALDPVSLGAAGWSSGLTAPRILRAVHTPMQLSSHKESQVRKRVHVPAGVVPHVLQWAEATFETGDEAARHQHATATELFYVRRGVLSIFFDAADDPTDDPPVTDEPTVVEKESSVRDAGVRAGPEGVSAVVRTKAEAETETETHEPAVEVPLPRRAAPVLDAESASDTLHTAQLTPDPSLPPLRRRLHTIANDSEGAAQPVPPMVKHELRAHDSVVIPPKRWHRMANLHEGTLELVYVTILTP